MIPLRDIIPSRTRPLVTCSLIAMLALVFLYDLGAGPGAGAPRELLGPMPGAPGVLMLASIFRHRDPLLLAVSTLYLWMFGGTVEDRLGHGRFLVFYLLCGTAAALARASADQVSLGAPNGAGAAVSGMMGAYVLLYPKSRVLTLVPVPLGIRLIEVPATFFFGIWAVVQLAVSLGPTPAGPASASTGAVLGGHLAAIATGLAGVGLFQRPERRRVEWWDLQER